MASPTPKKWNPPSITLPRLLLVEGRDEEEFFNAFCEHFQFADIQVIGVGKYSFRDRVELLRESKGFYQVRGLIAVRDADDSAEDAFKSVADAFESLNLAKPFQSFSFTDSVPQVGIIIMPPGGEGTGRMLEDLCLASMQDDPAMACVDAYYECLAGVDIQLPLKEAAKGRVHAFLASRSSDPAKQLGVAAQAGYWNFDSPVFSDIKEFLAQLARL